VTAQASAGALVSKRARTRQRILEAAAHELAQHGYGGTGLRQIAAAAHLQLGSLYFHFTSKDELVAETLCEGIDFALSRVTEALKGLDAGASQPTKLRTAVAAHIDALHANHDRAAVVARMAATLPPQLRQQHAVHERRYGKLWLDLLAEAQSGGAIDPSLDTRALRDIMVAAMNATLDTPSRSVRAREKLVDTLLRLVLMSTHVL
jgi:AcrR family transcriptional regulator